MFWSIVKAFSSALTKLRKLLKDSKLFILCIKDNIKRCCFWILVKSLTPDIGFQLDISSPFSSNSFSPSKTSVFLETIQLRAISPFTTLHPFCNSKEKPSLCVWSTHISTPFKESIIFSNPSKVNLTKWSIFKPVILRITADKFSALEPHPLLAKELFILWIFFVHGSSISKSLGSETIETLDWSSTITIKITSARLPWAVPLLAEEFSLLSSVPIIKYDVKKLSILFEELFINKLS